MGRRKLTKILLESGSLINERNAQEETVHDIAVRKNLTEILDILDTPLEKIRCDRERSSSSSKTNKKDGDSKDKTDSPAKSPRDKSKENKKSDKIDPSNWSPYGCHYFPDPRDFPSPKLDTLPEEPLSKGEQYYLDLAGNIKKGPVGIGNTCYCAPFFRHLEDRISKNKKSIRKYVDRATNKLDSKVAALALKTDDQIEVLTRSMIQEKVKCNDKRLHLEQWLKRGGYTRATVSAQTAKERKDQTNSNTLTKCKSLEFLDGDDDIFDSRLQSSTPGMSRSVDLLDSHEIIIHRNHDYSSSVNSTSRQYGDLSGSDRDKVSSLISSGKVRSKRNSERDHSDKERCSSRSDKERSFTSDPSKSTHRQESLGRSDLSKSNRRSSVSDLKDSRLDKSFVSERLNQLLAKTSEIIELERVSRRRNKDADKQSKRDKSHRFDVGIMEKIRRNSVNSESHENQSIEFEDSEFIAQEMEKITNSLLGLHQYEANAGQSIRHEKKDHFSTSPEIAKENLNQKENFKEEECESNKSETSNKIHLGSMGSMYIPDFSLRSGKKEEFNSRSFYGNQHELSTSFSDNVVESSGVAGPDIINTFYQNDCFEEDEVPSSSSNTLKSEKHEEIDDRCELSEMANMKELNELKSRILNGSHWRSQVLRRSAQEYNQNKDDMFENGDAEMNYEIKNSKIKTLKNEEILVIPSKNKVQDLVAKIQGIKNMIPLSNPKNSIVEYAKTEHSESSEDEEELPPLNAGSDYYVDHSQYNWISYEGYPMPEDIPYNYQNLPNSQIIYNEQSIDYSRVQSQMANYRTGLQRPSSSKIDTSVLIPKDAYFHELPNKNQMRPIMDKLTGKLDCEEQILQASCYNQNGSTSFNARNRNPLPLSVNDYSLPDLYQNEQVYIPNCTQNRPLKIVPQREKLLSSRKFGFNNLIDVELSKINLQIDPTLTIDQAQHERDMHNDSGYSTKICGSSHGPSPSLSGQIDLDLVGGKVGANAEKYDYSIGGSLGASSLV